MPSTCWPAQLATSRADENPRAVRFWVELAFSVCVRKSLDLAVELDLRKTSPAGAVVLLAQDEA